VIGGTAKRRAKIRTIKTNSLLKGVRIALGAPFPLRGRRDGNNIRNEQSRHRRREGCGHKNNRKCQKVQLARRKAASHKKRLWGKGTKRVKRQGSEALIRRRSKEKKGGTKEKWQRGSEWARASVIEVGEKENQESGKGRVHASVWGV